MTESKSVKVTDKNRHDLDTRNVACTSASCSLLFVLMKSIVIVDHLGE